MRLRSQSPTTTSNSTPQSTGQSSTSTPVAIKASVQHVPKRKSSKRFSRLGVVLLVSALTLTGVEVGRYITQAVIAYQRYGYFVYTGYFPQAAAYSPDGKYLAVCTPIAEQIDANAFALKGDTIDLYDSQTGKKIKSAYNGDIRFDGLSFSKNKNLIYGHSSFKKTTWVYDISTGESHQVAVDAEVLFSRLNMSDNSVVSIYRDRISLRGLDNFSHSQVFLPKKMEALDGNISDLNFSSDSRFISWVAYSWDNKKKSLRLADMKKGRVFDLDLAKEANIPMGEKLQQPIVVSADGKSVYLTGNVHKFPGSDSFSYGIAEVDLESGKIKRSQYQLAGIAVSHVKGSSVFVKNARGETAPLTQWVTPENTLMPVPNAIAVSPDKRWCLTYDRYGLRRHPMSGEGYQSPIDSR